MPAVGFKRRKSHRPHREPPPYARREELSSVSVCIDLASSPALSEPTHPDWVTGRT
jgi:hypothetical protein